MPLTSGGGVTVELNPEPGDPARTRGSLSYKENLVAVVLIFFSLSGHLLVSSRLSELGCKMDGRH